jgi:leader peptidase (prepilin peptidase)/N-methyltransferase
MTPPFLDTIPLGMVYLVYGLLALLIGSFISLLTWRLPEWFEGDSQQLWRVIAWERSRCCLCQSPLKAWQLIPLIGWLWQQGRSSCCAQKLPIRYPIIELTSLGLTFALLGFTPLEMTSSDPLLHLSLLSQLLFLWGLLSISIIDSEHHLIPDRLSLSLLWLGLLINSTSLQLVHLSDAVLGASIGYVSLWTLFQLHHALTGRIGMGYGDLKLTAAIGAWLGWQALIPLFLLASSGAIIATVIAVLVKKQQFHQHFAFGPWLSLAGAILLLASL